MRHFLYLCLALALASCQGLEDLGDLRGSTLDARHALPLVDTRGSLGAFLEAATDTSLLLVRPDGQVSLLYRENVIDEGSETLLAAILDFLPITVPVLSARQELPFSQPGQVELDRVDLRGGTISYLFRWTAPEAATVEIRVPQMRRDGQPLRITHRVRAASAEAPLIVVNRLSGSQLEGYRIDPEEGSVYIEYDAVLADGSSETLPGFLFRVEDLDITYAEGFLRSLAYPGPSGTIPIDIYKNWSLGSIFFEEPTARIFVENSIGFPVRVLVEQFDILSVDGSRVPLKGQPVEAGIDFPYPGLGQVGATVASRFVVDRENSNLQDLVAAQPTEVAYSFNAVTNPDNDPGLRGFITDSSFFRADLELELPLFGKVSNFQLRDTVLVDFSRYADVDFAAIRFIADNELPLALLLQLYFLDEAGNLTDSLYAEPELLLPAAPVDEEGMATETVRLSTEAILEDDPLRHALDARQMILAVRLNSPPTAGSGSVRVLARQEVHVRMGAIFGFQGED